MTQMTEQQRARAKEYRKTDKYKAANKIRQERYRKTQKRRECLARYRATEKGKATDRKHDLKNRLSPKRKEFLRQWEASETAKKIRAEYRARPETKDLKYEKSLKRFYKMTLEDYNKMFSEQGGICAICKIKKEGRLYVDHCHNTQAVRGLLCRECNLGIGFLKDNVDFLKSAIEYLL